MSVTEFEPEVLSTGPPREHSPRWWFLRGVAAGVVLTLTVALLGWWLDERVVGSAEGGGLPSGYSVGESVSAPYEFAVKNFPSTFAFATSQPVVARSGRQLGQLVRIQLTPEAVRVLEMGRLETRDVITEAVSGPGQTASDVEVMSVEGWAVAMTTYAVWGLPNSAYAWREKGSVVVLRVRDRGAAEDFLRAYLASLHGSA